MASAPASSRPEHPQPPPRAPPQTPSRSAGARSPSRYTPVTCATSCPCRPTPLSARPRRFACLLGRARERAGSSSCSARTRRGCTFSVRLPCALACQSRCRGLTDENFVLKCILRHLLARPAAERVRPLRIGLTTVLPFAKRACSLRSVLARRSCRGSQPGGGRGAGGGTVPRDGAFGPGRRGARAVGRTRLRARRALRLHARVSCGRTRWRVLPYRCPIVASVADGIESDLTSPTRGTPTTNRRMSWLGRVGSA